MKGALFAILFFGFSCGWGRVMVVADPLESDPSLSSFCENQIASLFLAEGIRVILPSYEAREGIKNGKLSFLSKEADLVIWVKLSLEEKEIRLLKRSVLSAYLTASVIRTKDGSIVVTKEASSSDPLMRKKEIIKEATEKLTKELIGEIRKIKPFLPSPFLAPISISDLSIKNIFPSCLNYYTSYPLGSLTIKNNTDNFFDQIKVSFFIPSFMELPYTAMVSLNPGSSSTIFLKPALSYEKLLEIDENIPVPCEIKVTYDEGGIKKEEAITSSLAILDRNAIDWENFRSVASFITPKDEAIKSFTHNAIAKAEGDLPEGIFYPAVIYEALSLSSLKYLPDPSSSYKERILDYVQYPKETLQTKMGDCDDLSVLYASCLFNLGIKTKLVITRNHIFPIFDTGVHQRNSYLISLGKNNFIIMDDKVWVPVETTAIGEPFIIAWEKGKENYKEGEGIIIDVESAWKDYPPFNLTLGLKEEPQDLSGLTQRINKLSISLKEREEEIYKGMVNEYQEKGFHNALGVLHARMKNYDLAENEFKIASSYNNLGNLYFIQGRFQEAEEEYKKACKEDTMSFLNLGILYLSLEKKNEAIAAIENLKHSFSTMDSIYRFLGIKEEIEEKGVQDTSLEKLKSIIDQALKDLPKEPKKETIAYFGGRRGERKKERRLCEWLYWRE